MWRAIYIQWCCFRWIVHTCRIQSVSRNAIQCLKTSEGEWCTMIQQSYRKWIFTSQNMYYETNTDVYLHLPICLPGPLHERTFSVQCYFPLWKGETYTADVRKQPRCCLLKKHFPEKSLAANSQFPDFTFLLFSLPDLRWRCSQIASKCLYLSNKNIGVRAFHVDFKRPSWIY